jgi:hypothetical protein
MTFLRNFVMNIRSKLSSMIRPLVALIALMTGGAAMAYEEPSYRVVHQGGEYEIRQYEDRIAAQVTSGGSQNGSFGLLFQYISGANTASEKVAMTIPVAQSEKIAMTVPVAQSSGGQSGFMQFFLPAQYTLETSPKPTNPRVEIVSVEGGYYAVRTYKGSANEKNFLKAQSDLLNQLAIDGVATSGQVIRATYNGPFTPPFMRRNEAMVRVDWNG